MPKVRKARAPRGGPGPAASTATSSTPRAVVAAPGVAVAPQTVNQPHLRRDAPESGVTANVSEPVDADNLDISELSQKNKKLVFQLVKGLSEREVELDFDAKGHVTIDYMKKSRKSLDDASKANVIATPKPGEDVAAMTDAFIKLINDYKREIPPAGVLLDKSRVSLSPGKEYREGQEFSRTGEELGRGNMAGKIFVVKDEKSGKVHALKSMMISFVRGNEIRCWVNLSVSEYAPKLYLFNIQNNKVNFHMEILGEAMTLYSVIHERIKEFETDNNRALKKPFCLYVLDRALEAMSYIHEKGWIHKDLHDENMMLQKTAEHALKVKFLDFGNADAFDDKDFKRDLWNVISVFTELYADSDLFRKNQNFRNESKILEELEKSTGHVERSAKEELFCIVKAALKIDKPNDVTPFRKMVGDKLNEAMGYDPDKILERFSQILFPVYLPIPDMPLKEMRPKRKKQKDVAGDCIDSGEDLKDFVIEHIPPKGRGVRTTIKRTKGDFLIIYPGELITERDGEVREEQEPSVFRYFFEHKRKVWCIDASTEVDVGHRLGRLVNHGRKDRNCVMKTLEFKKRPYLCLFAAKDIPQGEELLYDYGIKDLPWETPSS